MITKEEKFSLASELGLSGVVRQLALEVVREREALEMKKEAAALSSMKFPLITLAQIKEKLPKDVRVPMDWTSDNAFFMFFVLPILWGGAGVIGLIFGHVFAGVLVGSAALLLGEVLVYRMATHKEVQVREMALQSWEGEIPYGALLAVKEAKAAGLGNFRIFYPSVQAPGDPVIVSVGKHGTMLEIFSWDTGKVYE